jgi:hypothetical protein
MATQRHGRLDAIALAVALDAIWTILPLCRGVSRIETGPMNGLCWQARRIWRLRVSVSAALFYIGSMVVV